jgi:hypothetical protein
MRPEDRGRFCAACSKTVVDFTGLSDREVLAYLARAGRGLCGRFSTEQVGRGLELMPAKRGVRWWWQWLVAGLLVSAEVRGQGRPKVEVVVAAPPTRVKALELTERAKVKVLPEAVVYSESRRYAIAGLFSVVMVRSGNWLQDSLYSLASVKKELTVYPNPVRRGMVVSLSWTGMESGEYEVRLFSAAGQLVERRVIAVSGKEQIDLIGIPASLAEGIYFLRVARAGEARVLSRKLVVL